MKNKLLAVLLALLIPAVLTVSDLRLPEIYQDSYYAELAPMTERLYGAEGKKLVLVGGSGVAFGVDGGLLERLLKEKGFDYTVCPYGLYAAVGTSAMLDLSRNALREGDIVVIMFEPASDALSGYFGATAFLKCAEGHPDLIAKLGGGKLKNVIGNLIPYLQEKYGVVRSGVLPRAEGVYAKAAFDEDCTMVYDRPGNRMALGYDTASLIDLDAVTVDPDFASRVNSYCASARKKGAEVYMSFAPMDRSAVTGSLKDHFDMMNRTFDCTVISDPQRLVMDAGWFYDSNFHLNSAGQTLRTWYLAEDLLAQLGFYGALDYEAPLMPDPMPAESGLNGDGAGLVTEPIGDTDLIRVTGLTPEGLEKQTIVIPDTIGGRTVADISPDALRGADRLEELHIPGTVEVLPDYLLLNCPGLKRLVLTHTSAPCGLTEHSLDGADNVQILVPAAAYPWYRDGYGCEENPWRGRIGQIYAY